MSIFVLFFLYWKMMTSVLFLITRFYTYLDYEPNSFFLILNAVCLQEKQRSWEDKLSKSADVKLVIHVLGK